MNDLRKNWSTAKIFEKGRAQLKWDKNKAVLNFKMDSGENITIIK